MKKLMIIESPNKIKKLKSILGSDFDIKATVGHFRELSSVGEARVGVDANFNPQFIISKDKYKTWNDIKTNIDKYDVIYLASDPDREGEAIAWHVYDALDKNARAKCKRITFNEITESAIKKSLQEPRNIDMNLVKAQFLRQVGDKLIGYKGSRVVQRLGSVKSTGRVQGVALKLLIDKENEINNYKEIRKNKYEAIIKDDNQKATTLTHVDSNFSPLSYDLNAPLPEVGNTLVLKETITDTPKGVLPYKPFMTSTLLKKGVGMGMSAKVVQKAMQDLFEAGLITYPRTDSPNLSDEFKRTLMGYLKAQGETVRNFIPNHSASKGSQGAHECIRVTHLETKPTDKKISAMGTSCQKVYKLVYDYTYIQGLENAVYIDTSYIFNDKNNNLFKVVSKKYQTLGWKKYFGVENEEQLAFTNNKEYLAKIEKKNFVSNPKPNPYNEASLIATLEKLEIGRPSTYASYINILKDRNYADVSKNQLIPNENGKVANTINEKYISEFVNLDFTAKVFEKKCDEVEQNKAVFNDVLKQWNQDLDKIVARSYDPANKIENTFRANQESVKKDCLNCKATTRIKVKSASNKIYYKCESSKYDPKTKTWSGCPIEWDNAHNNKSFFKQKAKVKAKTKSRAKTDSDYSL